MRKAIRYYSYLLFCLFIASCTEEKPKELTVSDTTHSVDTIVIPIDTFPKRFFFEDIVFHNYWIESGQLKKGETLYDSASFTLLSDSSICYDYFPEDKRSYRLTSLDTLTFLQQTVPQKNNQPSYFGNRTYGNHQEIFEINEEISTFFRASWWRCSDPNCEAKHGHVQQNETLYIDKELGILCRFSQMDPNSVTLLFSINGTKVDPQIHLAILKKYEMHEKIIEAVQNMSN